jgi:hypothetical protein
MDVVGMVVRPEYRIDPVDPVGDELSAQVWRGVDEQPPAFVALDDDRDARAPVFSARLDRIGPSRRR